MALCRIGPPGVVRARQVREVASRFVKPSKDLLRGLWSWLLGTVLMTGLAWLLTFCASRLS